jgi:motility quorum-sensing regulator/GCU-specific mRNA interferase toxin
MVVSGMEERKAHYALSRVKALIREGAYRVTRTSLRCAARDFGYVQASQLAERVLRLQVKDFHKSMTTFHDSKLWQDVYHPRIDGTPAYVKMQIVDDTAVVILFKVLEGD